MVKFGRRWAGGATVEERTGGGENNLILVCPCFFFKLLAGLEATSPAWRSFMDSPNKVKLIPKRKCPPRWLSPQQTASMWKWNSQRYQTSQPPTFYQICSVWTHPDRFAVGLFQYMVSRQAIPFPLLPSNFCTFRNASLIAKEAWRHASRRRAKGRCNFPPFSAIFCTPFPAKQMAGKRKRRFCLMKPDLCVQGDSGAQMGAEHLFFQPKPLIHDERKRHKTCITCPTDMARLLLAYETQIYSSERMLICSPHNVRLWFWHLFL